jgi:tagatose-1,6-bisphosphate aldolase
MIAGAALAGLLDSSGRFTILALDHRDSLRLAFDPDDPAAVTTDDLVRFKLDVIEAFGDRPSAVMLDPELSIDQVLRAGRLPAGVGSLCALEAQGYLGDPDVTVNRLLDGWTPQRARSVGASAAKLLVLYRPDRGAITVAQDDLIRSVVDGCRKAELPLFVEPVPYEITDVEDRERTILDSATRIAALGPDVIKMPFPSDAEHPKRWERACRRINDGIDVPWAVLSWGARFELFVDQVAVACANGCSGFMAGRAIWGDSIHAGDRSAHLRRVALPRFDALVAATR